MVWPGVLRSRRDDDVSPVSLRATSVTGTSDSVYQVLTTHLLHSSNLHYFLFKIFISDFPRGYVTSLHGHFEL